MKFMCAAILATTLAGPAFGQSYQRYGTGWRGNYANGYNRGYSSGYSEVRSYQYQSYGYPNSNFVGRRNYNGRYPNATVRHHYTVPNVTTGLTPSVSRYGYSRGGYGYTRGGYGYTRGGYGAGVPRYYGR